MFSQLNDLLTASLNLSSRFSDAPTSIRAAVRSRVGVAYSEGVKFTCNLWEPFGLTVFKAL
jgi:hypothetical protein